MITPPTPTPQELFDQGLTDLVSIIPPNAPLCERSTIQRDSLGKAPGIRRHDGKWTGYRWRNHSPSANDRQAMLDTKANIGLRTKHFPVIDVDCTDPELAATIEREVHACLGPAPVRIGRPPKRSLLYTTSSPFPKATLHITRNGEKHMVEVLADGQQSVIAGIHPGTMQPFTWDRPLGTVTAASLTVINATTVTSLLERLQATLTPLGWTCTTSHGTSPREHSPVPQAELLAPSIEALREAMPFIPNDEKYENFDSYLAMMYAVRAASAKDPTAGLEIFQEWAARWEGATDPGSVERDWNGLHPPFTIGWEMIASRARQHGFDTARFDFEVIDAPAAVADDRALEDSDQGLAERFAVNHAGLLRHIPLSGTWYHWDSARWAKDELLLARDRMKAFLRKAAAQVMRRPCANAKQVAERWRLANKLSSAATSKHILDLASSDPRLTTTPDKFDVDPWLLNTPAGIVDLRTGKLTRHDPDAMMAKITTVGPRSSTECPRWDRFLAETTGGDPKLIAYLQRLCGYCLTGSTREQAIVFVYGPGGNGKSVFLNTLLHILGDYGKQAAMSVFLSNGRSEHPTELASLQGARVVAANETNSGGKWNEARLKSLSGGDRISARFLYGDHFEFTPVLKLLLVGNTKPSFPGVDDAMRRRLHLVSFTRKPITPDRDLFEKLKEEAPGILAWMIEGCRAWQEKGLNPPASVLEATEAYLDDQDSIGRWLLDSCVLGSKLYVMNDALYTRYKEWCDSCGEQVLSWNELRARLVEKGFTPFQNPKEANRRGLKGLALRPSEEFAAPTNGASPAPEAAA